MKFIQLTKNKHTLVDDEDFERLSQFKWFFACGYAGRWFRTRGKTLRVHMHRFIINAPDNMQVDHVNGDRLDNRKCNLRLCSHADNMRNKPKKKNNTSGYKGVYWHKKDENWHARIGYGKASRSLYLGSYSTAEQAAAAYNFAARCLHGEFARLNDVKDIWT